MKKTISHGQCPLVLLCGLAALIVGTLSSDCSWKLDRCVHKSVDDGFCAAELSRKCFNEKKTVIDIEQWCNYLCQERWQWSAWGSWTQNNCFKERHRKCVPPKSGKQYVACPNGKTKETKNVQECIPTQPPQNDSSDDVSIVGPVIGGVMATLGVIALILGVRVYFWMNASRSSGLGMGVALPASRPLTGSPIVYSINQSNYNSPVAPPYATMTPALNPSAPPENPDSAGHFTDSNRLVASSSSDKEAPPQYEEVVQEIKKE